MNEGPPRALAEKTEDDRLLPNARRRLLLAGIACSPVQEIVGRACAAENPVLPADDDEDCRRGRAAIEQAEQGASRSGERFDDPLRGARGNGFNRPSLTVELDADYVDYSEGFLRGPRCYSQPFVRAYVHETLHFWQALSQGFITNLAMQESELVRDFHESGTTTGHAGLMTRFNETGGAPFSVWMLSEALCRYWDIHILGPERLLRERGDNSVADHSTAEAYSNVSFDRLMTLEDSWAGPYRWALENWGSNASVLLFPLAGHFAMQTRRPVEVLITAASALHERAKALSGDIHANWRLLYADVRRHCEEACFKLNGSSLTPGWRVIRDSSLSQSKVWRPYLQQLIVVMQTAEGRRLIDEAFALPGDPEYRGLLISGFVPALTLFRDGRWSGASLPSASRTDVQSDAVGSARMDPGADANETANSAESTLADYRAMRRAEVMQRYLSPRGEDGH